MCPTQPILGHADRRPASSDSKVARLYLPPGKPEPRAGIPNGKSRRRQPGCQCATGTRPRESCLHRSEPTLISLKLLLLLKYLTQNIQKVLNPFQCFSSISRISKIVGPRGGTHFPVESTYIG